MVDITALNSLDEALMDAAKSVKPLYYIEPTNDKEQKAEFLTGRIQNPGFEYRELEYNPQEVVQILNSIKIPDDDLGKIFDRKRTDTLVANRIICNRGNEALVREATIAMHGSPSEQLVAYADELLRKIPATEAQKTVPSEEVKNSLETALYENGLTDWKVEFSDKRLTTVYPAEKKITVCKDRKFAGVDSERLKVHEVGVHAVRAANGYEQPLKIFALGLPGYLPTEEGLTSYFEELTGNSSEEMMRDYAARVIAVDSVCKGLNFKQTFDKLKSYHFTDNQTWDLGVRAHRAGGYIKDHVYLDGYRQVKEFAGKEGDFKTLYVGKIGIGDLPLIRKLLTEGIIKEAKHIPHFDRM